MSVPGTVSPRPSPTVRQGQQDRGPQVRHELQGVHVLPVLPHTPVHGRAARTVARSRHRGDHLTPRHALTPVQQRTLERALLTKVIDRTGLILEVLGARARTHEGRLQVELAALGDQRSRLVRSWTHLERQRRGFGFLGGPGETQIEADRRVIQDRIRRIEHDLETVKQTRELHRVSRRRVPYPIVALVGYTNAGKSTLFNRASRLTNGELTNGTPDDTGSTTIAVRGRRRLPDDETADVPYPMRTFPDPARSSSR